MGIDAATARLLHSARQRGVSFRQTATFGVQDWHVSDREHRRLVDEFGAPPGPVATGADFLRLLGAEAVDAVDVSDYEGATVLHDLNEPLGDEHKGRYTAVVDGGTLEHVFNVTVGLRNAMELVAEGGHLLLCNPANNLLGHGFYQFSPELHFRALSAENGYRVERVVLVEEGGGWYDVADPAEVRARVQVTNDRPTYLFTQARRVEAVVPFGAWPQQSDYRAIWDDHAGARDARRSPAAFAVRQRLRAVGPLWRLLRRLKGAAQAPGERRRRSFENRRHFRPVDR